MRILLTGDRGYVGTVLSKELLDRGYDLVGLDCCFFEENLLLPLQHEYQKITKDIRDRLGEKAEFVWMENPKMSITELYHVQIFVRFID